MELCTHLARSEKFSGAGIFEKHFVASTLFKRLLLVTGAIDIVNLLHLLVKNLLRELKMVWLRRIP